MVPKGALLYYAFIALSFDEKPNSSKDKVDTNASITRTGLSAAMDMFNEKSEVDGGCFLRSVACEPVVVALQFTTFVRKGKLGVVFTV